MVWFAYFISEPYSNLIEQAFETLSNDEDVKAIKVPVKDILLNFNKLEKNCCFIFSEFFGEAFDFLVSKRASIFGPNAILDCVKQEEGLPKYDYPLFSRKLKGTKICVSQIDSKEKEKLFKMIEMMEGCGYEKLTNSVKVLLTRNVDSQKYVVAHLNKIHVLLPDWIYDNWKLSSQVDEYNPFSKDCLMKFKVPIFFNLKICLSGFSVEIKSSFKKMIEINGGIYFTELKNNEVTHLVTETDTSQKFVYAKQWKIKTVTAKWLTDSVSQGYCVESSKYEFPDNKGNIAKMIFSQCVIGFFGCTSEFIKKWQSIIESNSGRVIIDNKSKETPSHIIVDNEKGLVFKKNLIYLKKSWLEKSLEKGKSLPVEEYKLSEQRTTANLFTNCVILFNSCSEEFVNKWTPLIQLNSGRIISDLEVEHEPPTHIVVEKLNNLNLNSQFDYVTKFWLEQSLENGKCLPADAFKLEIDEDLICDWDEEWLDDDSMSAQDPDTNTNTQNSSIDAAGNIFIDCLILFHGCSDQFVDKWTRIIANNHGTIITELNGPIEDRIYIVVDNKENLIRRDRLKYVNKIWLEQCLEKKRLLPIEEFILEWDKEESICLIDSDCDFQENLNLFNGCIIGFHGCSQEFIHKWRLIITNHSGQVVLSANDDYSRTSPPTHIVVDDDSRLLTISQYTYVGKSWLEQSFEANKILPVAKFIVKDCFDELGIDFNELDSSMGDASAGTSAHKETVIIDTNSNKSGLFSSISFFIDESISNYTSGRLIRSITQNGGRVTENSMNCSYLVANILLNHRYKCRPETQIVTEYYTRQSIINNRLLNTLDHFLYCPIVVRDVSSVKKLLANCVLTFSGFDSVENEELAMFAQRLGATVQEIIMQRECTNKKLKANSHVIAYDRNSNGFRSAIKWNIPIVNKEWLHSCAVHKAKQDYADFLIDNKQRFDWRLKTIPNQSQPMIIEDCENVNSVITLPPVVHVRNAHKSQNVKDINNSENPLHTVITRSLKRKNSESISVELETVKVTERNSTALLSEQDLQYREVAWNYEISNDVIESENYIKVEVDKENIKRSRHTSVSASPIVINDQKKKTARSKTQTKMMKTEANEAKSQMNTNNNIGKEIRPEAKEVNMILKEQNSKAVVKNSAKVFAFKGLSEDEILKSSSIIYNLGGRFIRGSLVSHEVTHLISKEFSSRDVNILAGISAGIWVLHYSYINASAKESKWLNEEHYEWGVNGTLAFFSKHPQEYEVQRKLAVAAKKWRRSGVKAFDKWRIILIEHSGKLESFRRIFDLGGAEVLTIVNSFPAQSEFTHAILNKNCRDYSGILLPLDYKWINIKYVITYLMDGRINPKTIKPAYFYSKEDIIDFNNSILQKSKTKKG